MKLIDMIDDFDSKGRCLKQFAKFMKTAEAKHFSALSELLKAYNKEVRAQDYSSNFELSDVAIPALTETIAADAGNADAQGEKGDAHRLGFSFRCAMWQMYYGEATPADRDLLNKLLGSPGLREAGSVITVMRKLVEEHDAAAKGKIVPLTPKSTRSKRTAATIARTRAA